MYTVSQAYSAGQILFPLIPEGIFPLTLTNAGTFCQIYDPLVWPCTGELSCHIIIIPVPEPIEES